MEHYQKVQKPKEETKENEIKVAASGQVPKYLSYAFRILKHSDKYNSITIRASGNAIVKAMQIVELIKRKIGFLHQINKIQTMVIVDKYEPKVEGLPPQETTRRVTAFDCILSKEQLDEKDPGYQAPKPPEEPQVNRPAVPRKNTNPVSKPRQNTEAKEKQNTEPKERAPAEPRNRGANRGTRGARPQRRYNDDTDVQADTKEANERKQQFKREVDIEERLTAPPRERGQQNRGRARVMRGGNTQGRQANENEGSYQGHEHEPRQNPRAYPPRQHYDNSEEQETRYRGAARERGSSMRGSNMPIRSRDDFHLNKRPTPHYAGEHDHFDNRRQQQEPPIRRGGRDRPYNGYQGERSPQDFDRRERVNREYGAPDRYEGSRIYQQHQPEQRFYQEEPYDYEKKRGGMMRGRGRVLGYSYGQQAPHPNMYYEQPVREQRYYNNEENDTRYQQQFDEPPRREARGRGMRQMNYNQGPETVMQERRQYAEDRHEFHQEPYGSGEPIRAREGHMRVRAGRGEIRMRGTRGSNGMPFGSHNQFNSDFQQQRRFNNDSEKPVFHEEKNIERGEREAHQGESNLPLRGHRGSRGGNRGYRGAPTSQVDTDHQYTVGPEQRRYNAEKH